MKFNQLVVLFVLFASCNGRTNLEEKVAESKPEITIDSTRKTSVVAPEKMADNSNPSQSEAPQQKVINPAVVPGANVALAFMNSYVNFCNDRKINAIDWVNNSRYATSKFKAKHKSLQEEAWKDDPELGLGFDPIFDAQDYPDDGFNLIAFDKESYLTLQGKNWPEFTVVIKVKQEGNNWLVDGAGVINIPESKRARR